MNKYIEYRMDVTDDPNIVWGIGRFPDGRKFWVSFHITDELRLDKEADNVIEMMAKDKVENMRPEDISDLPVSPK